MNEITVIVIHEPPALGKPEMCQGIKDEQAARAWGKKHGYSTVYYFRKRERVYADKQSKPQLTLA
jgi:hypothetical protein